MSNPLHLQNAYLDARFSAATGALTALAPPAGANLVDKAECALQAKPDWHETAADPKTEIRLGEQSLRTCFTAEGLTVEREWSLPSHSPLLKLTMTLRAGAQPVEVTPLGLPCVDFTDGYTAIYEDSRDLYFDGEELPGGRELPCWRVFFREGHQTGLLVLTRSKLQMSHLHILPGGFHVLPQVMINYSTNYHLPNEPLILQPGETMQVALEMGPWSANQHDALLAAAEANTPSDVGNPPATGEPPRDLAGQVFKVLDTAPAESWSESYDPAKWRRVQAPFCLDGEALFCGPGSRPPALTLSPNLQGPHHVYLGIGNSHGAMAQFSKDAMPIIRLAPKQGEGKTPFYLLLSGHQQAAEVLLGTVEMDDQSLTLERFRNSYASTILDYVRFEPLSATEAQAWRARCSADPVIELSGFNDIPDIARLTDVRDPDPLIYAANLWEHAKAKVNKVFWRIDGQCSDFPSRHNTMRYESAKVHGLFHPQGKAYGRVLRKTDMLELAVTAARRFGLQLYGWQRFNNYGGNVQSDFFRQHPEYHEEWENGYRANKLCLAFPEVRQHKIAILVEAATYGLAGLCLGFLRHPPILCHAPVLIDGYKQRYGKEPPRDRQNPDTNFRFRLPPDDPDHLQWFAYRAEFMTTFMHELHEALAAEDLDHLPIAIWVRPNHCLFDGIDLDTWLEEGLIDEVVADTYNHPDVCQVQPEWQEKVQAKVSLIRGVNGLAQADPDEFERYLAAGFDGICTYESDYTVLENEWLRIYEGLRR